MPRPVSSTREIICLITVYGDDRDLVEACLDKCIQDLGGELLERDVVQERDPLTLKMEWAGRAEVLTIEVVPRGTTKGVH